MNIDIAAVEARHSDGVFFCGDDEFSAGSFCVIDKVDEFLLSVTVVIGVVSFENEDSAEVFEESFEAGWVGDGGDGCDFEAFEGFEGVSMAAVEDFLQVLGFMAAFDDFGAVVMFSDEVFEVAESGGTVGFCQEDVIGAEDMFDGFAHESAG